MILALDFGDRFIGMAAAEPPDVPIHRFGIIDQSKERAIQRIQEIIAQEGITKILVGVPVSLSGNETEQTFKTLTFIEKLRESISSEVDIEEVDETLTSVEAARNITAEGGRPENEHAEAARIMLQDYLNSRPQFS